MNLRFWTPRPATRPSRKGRRLRPRGRGTDLGAVGRAMAVGTAGSFLAGSTLMAISGDQVFEYLGFGGGCESGSGSTYDGTYTGTGGGGGGGTIPGYKGKGWDPSIPGNFLKIYKKAGEDYKIAWPIIAGVGSIETNHQRLKSPGVTSGENYAGAGGPMQFLGPTWDQYGVDGNGDGTKDRYNPEDAIPAAANYLTSMIKTNSPQLGSANGGGKKRSMEERALFGYNRAWWYVEDVMWRANHFADGKLEVSDSVGRTVDAASSPACTASAGADDAPLNGSAAEKAIQWARRQMGKPYVYGAAGPDSWDCSSLLWASYREAGMPKKFVNQRWTTEYMVNAMLQPSFGAKKVSMDSIQPGDMIVTAPGASGPTTHVVMYTGRKNGKMMVIEAYSSSPPPDKQIHEHEYDSGIWPAPANVRAVIRVSHLVPGGDDQDIKAV